MLLLGAITCKLDAEHAEHGEDGAACGGSGCSGTGDVPRTVPGHPAFRLLMPEVPMVRPVVLRIVVAVATALVALSACSSAGRHDQRSVTVSETRGHDGIEVAVSKELAGDLLQGVVGSELSCDADLDPDFEGLLRELDRRGRGARATLVDGDDTIVARRRARTLELDVRGTDGGLEVIMPWAVAECLLGRTTALKGGLDDVRVTLRGADGGSFEIHVD